MNASTFSDRTVVVIGGGVSGLSAALHVAEHHPQTRLILLEASSRLGGVLQTDARDGFLIERSADNFLTKSPWGVELCRRVGMADELIPTDARFRGAFVVRRGKLVRVPEGFLLAAPRRLGPMLRTPLLSPWGKLRAAADLLAPRGADAADDESVRSFVVRRFGRQVYDRLAQPLLGGIYTADAARLSMAATLPQLFDEERRERSLLLAAWRRSRAASRDANEAANSSSDASDAADGRDRGARYSMFVAPRKGMERIVEAVADGLPPGAVRLNQAALGVRRSDDDRLRVELTPPNEDIACDAVVIATPPRAAARLLGALDPQLAALLAGIESASSAVVLLGFRRDQIAHPLDGFGVVVPAIENRRILAASFASVKFPERAPAGCELVRVFIGGALQPELLGLDDSALIDLARQELSELIGARGQPLLADVARWNEAMPQYHVGHLARVAQIDARLAVLPGLAVAGAAYHGVGIPQCVQSGQMAAARALGEPAVPRASDSE